MTIKLIPSLAAAGFALTSQTCSHNHHFPLTPQQPITSLERSNSINSPKLLTESQTPKEANADRELKTFQDFLNYVLRQKHPYFSNVDIEYKGSLFECIAQPAQTSNPETTEVINISSCNPNYWTKL